MSGSTSGRGGHKRPAALENKDIRGPPRILIRLFRPLSGTHTTHLEIHGTVLETRPLNYNRAIRGRSFTCYLRLEYSRHELTLELVLDDQLWEKAKPIPIDRNNWEDRFNRKMKELDEAGMDEQRIKKEMATDLK